MRIIHDENYIEKNMIMQGNNINNLRNLKNSKNFKNENLNINIKSPNNQEPGLINSYKNDDISHKKKNNPLVNKSESISNMNTNPSTVQKIDTLTNNLENEKNNFSQEGTSINVK